MRIKNATTDSALGEFISEAEEQNRLDQEHYDEPSLVVVSESDAQAQKTLPKALPISLPPTIPAAITALTPANS